MNRFGRLAMAIWAETAPESLAEIEDRDAFFTMLGMDAEGAWFELSRQLAGPDLPGETWLEKVGRINNARLRAEEIVRSEVLMPPSSTVTSEQEEPEDLDWIDPSLVFWQDTETARQAALEEDATLEASRTDDLS